MDFLYIISSGTTAACPRGFNEKPGDIRGKGLVDSFAQTLHNCSEICKLNPHCKAFMHSKKVNKCKLLPFPNPSHGPYPNWIFCQKQGMRKLSMNSKTKLLLLLLLLCYHNFDFKTTMLIKDYICDVGYTKKSGSLSGGGGLLGALYPYTNFECQQLCDKHKDCNGFQYSPEKHQCKIIDDVTTVSDINHHKRYQDFTWCSKGSNCI